MSIPISIGFPWENGNPKCLLPMQTAKTEYDETKCSAVLWSVISIHFSIRLIVFDVGTADRHHVPGIDPDVTPQAFDGHRVEDALASRWLPRGGRTDTAGLDELDRQPWRVVFDRVVPRTAGSLLQIVHRLRQVVDRQSAIRTRRLAVAP